VDKIVLDVDDRGRITVGKLLEGADRVIATQVAPGRVLLESAVVVRAMVPVIKANPDLSAAIDQSLRPDQDFVTRRPKIR
jgi:hypothetical protein